MKENVRKLRQRENVRKLKRKENVGKPRPKKRRNLVAKSFGYKDIKIYMTSDEISSAANCTLRTEYFSKCYGIDNIKFQGEFRISSEFKKPVLNLLILDMGPLDSYSWASFLMNWREARS